MKFLVNKSSEGAVSKKSPCPGAVRGRESVLWPGEYEWTVDLKTLEELMAFLEKNGGGIGLFSPEEGEESPGIEIYDDDEDCGHCQE